MLPGVVSAHQVTCAVCETPQPPASLCANCGMRLKVPAGMLKTADPAVERVPDFEPTAAEAVPELRAAAPVGLEQTCLEATPAVVAPIVEGFETTQQLLIDLPGDERLAGLEVADAFEKTSGPDALDPLDCPYCGFHQPVGRVCDNCGRMRTRVLRRVAGDPRDGPMVSCRGCGARVSHQTLCSDCGHPLPPVET